MPNLFDMGASASLNPGGFSSGTTAGGNVPPQGMQILQALAQAVQAKSAGTGGGGNSGGDGLTSFGSQPPNIIPQPTLQPSQTQEPGYQHSYRSTGERNRTEKEALFHNIGGLVQSFTDKKNADTARHSQILTERVMSAMSGLEEAKASGNKEAIQHNASIINDIMSDPKQRKILEKALDINFLGNSKGKDSPEQKGFFTALQKMDQDFKSGKSPLNAGGQLLEKNIPQRVQLSPELQAQAEAVKAKVLPSADELVKSQTQQAIQNIRSTDAATRTQAMRDIATMSVGAKDRASAARIEAEAVKGFNQQQLAEYKATKQQAMQTQRLNQTKQLFEQGLKFKTALADANLNDKTVKDLVATQGKLSAQLKSAQDAQAKAEKNITTLAGKGWFSKMTNSSEMRQFRKEALERSFDATKLQSNIQTNNAQMQMYMQLNKIKTQLDVQDGMSGLFPDDGNDDSSNDEEQ